MSNPQELDYSNISLEELHRIAQRGRQQQGAEMIAFFRQLAQRRRERQAQRQTSGAGQRECTA